MLIYVPKQWKINNLFTSKVLGKIVDFIETHFNSKCFNVHCYDTSDAPYIAFDSINSDIVSGQELAAMCTGGEFITGTLFFQYATSMVVYNLVKYYYDLDNGYVVMRYAAADNSFTTRMRLIEMHILPDSIDGFEVNEVFFNG